MRKTHGPSDEFADGALLALLRAIAALDHPAVARLLDSSPGLASDPIRIAASRQDAETYFLTPIRHYAYAGDTALHVAAAAYQPELVASLVARGAGVRARNRRGAQPIHYAADGSPDSDFWNPDAQHDVIVALIAAGADPNALDKEALRD